MIRRSLLLSFAALSLLLNACSSRDSRGMKERNFFDGIFGRDTYASIFDKMTVEQRVHSEFEPVMTSYATLWNTELREAYVKEMAARFRLTPEAEKNLATEQLQEDESFYVFIVSAATREPEWNDLDRAKSIWRITLENPDATIQADPERVELVSQKDERAAYFYKHMGTFTKTYKIRFPKESMKDSSQIQLHISGPRGSLTFSYQVPPPVRPSVTP